MFKELRRYAWISREILCSPYAYLAILAALAVEFLRPVTRDRRHFYPGLVQDFIWFLTDSIFQATLLPVYLGFLEMFYQRHLNFLTVASMQTLPLPLKFLSALLIQDLCQWIHHWIRHKVTVFWYFHSVHHSSRGINIFTDLRVHPVEYLITRTMAFIPLFMFDADPFTITGVALFTRWYTRIYHGNLKTNYGPLKYFLVTPQSHRIHHSIKPEHRDKNFGVLFTFWDRMFGTLYAKYDEYPETGIDDPEFPLEQTASPALFGNYFKQILYPFKRIFTTPPSSLLGRP